MFSDQTLGNMMMLGFMQQNGMFGMQQQQNPMNNMFTQLGMNMFMQACMQPQVQQQPIDVTPIVNKIDDIDNRIDKLERRLNGLANKKPVYQPQAQAQATVTP